MLDAPGAPFRLATIPRPRPGPGQVLVRIAASGMNPLDGKIRAGEAPHARQPLPAILGIDMAGTVEAVGENVVGFKLGDEVYGMTGGVGGHQGSLAEYAAVAAELLALKPKNLGMSEAASLPLVCITAWEGLVDRAAVGAGQSVLVLGGAGGVGRAALQIAKAFGANVYATGSPASAAPIEALGAQFIDRSEPIAEAVGRLTGGRGFDLVYDTVGGAVLDSAFVAVRRFGRVVSCLGWGAHLLAPLSFRAASYSGVFTLLPLLTGEGRARHGQILADVARLVEAGRLTTALDPRRFTLETVTDAYLAAKVASGRGKLVIEIESAGA
jgi:NADPH2:quinone reductase